FLYLSDFSNNFFIRNGKSFLFEKDDKSKMSDYWTLFRGSRQVTEILNFFMFKKPTPYLEFIYIIFDYYLLFLTIKIKVVV
ncbi:MAG: hypothetical protein D6734_05040, partial [Candidatus Schekmanbacteria bacterium]